MAEFQEVMRQLNRLCSNYQNCEDSDCPLYGNCGTIGHYSSNAKQAMRIEKIVMSWAAEHPEPVYPTWGDYLISKGILMPYWNERGTAPYDMYIYAERALANRIPADIAEKLGIQPKEDT